MGPFGHIIAPLLFIAILFAGITSAVAVFEPMINSTSVKMNWTRKKTVTVLSIIGCAFSLIFTTGISSYLVGIVDGFITEFCILLLIVIQSIIFTWFYDIEGLIPVLNENDKVKVGKWWVIILKYILPILLLVMWISGVYNLTINSSVFEKTVFSVIGLGIIILSYVFTKTGNRAD
jgi:NSS family neurotransmitter:Na+ symporter